ncbi:hypothetical protein GCM10022237_37790 [Nocardioides ginsengisoli]|uniref:Integral membrane protein n=1 Tax=Nocardioides ginsengisoli TaxID=363868 RepID=A0ABW3W027_9ACTN
MPVGLACAVGTALCYGIGSVLQAAAARAAPPVLRLDPRLLLELARGWRYPVGLGLDTLGFVLSLVALRTLPLYVVQSVAAGFLAVTAVVGVVLLGLRMRGAEVAALVVVVVGLTLVGLSAAPESARAMSTRGQWVLLATAVALVAVAVPLSRAWQLGAVGGLGFGVVAVAARVLSPPLGGDLRADLVALVQSPATYALLVAAPLGLVAYATALQRGSVVEATAPLVVTETVLPAAVGLSLLGDHARTGWGAVAVLGFVLAVGATLLLSRFGEVEEPVQTSSG